MPANSPPIELDAVVGLFFDSVSELAQFDTTPAADLPTLANHLLNHDHHMTVTVEQHHGCPVNVKVLAEFDSGSHYCRKILLTRSTDDAVVQFGIVRLDMSVLPDEVRLQIREKQIPLGRILISHDVMRAVKLNSLYRITTGSELAGHFGQPEKSICFGRTAWMYCNGKPAIELLEIVPVPATG